MMAFRSDESAHGEQAQPLRVKICGITRVEDALAAIDLGAWALGLMFYPDSSRAIRFESALDLVAKVRRLRPEMTCQWVGVFVNQSPFEMVTFAKGLRLDYVQMHGDEDLEKVEYFDSLTTELDGRARIIKALRTTPDIAAEDLRPFRKYCPLLLVDSYVKDRYGGTGKTADWPAARAICADGPALLAGGITPDNVRDAVAATKPWGIDLSSGVEQEPGIKDHHKLRQLFAALAAE